MLSVFVLVSVLVLAAASALLVLSGHRVRRASPALSLLLAGVAIVATGETAARAWQLPSGDVLLAELYLLVITVGVVQLTRVWNPVGHLFFSATLSAALAYLVLMARATVAGGMSPVGAVASGALWVLEALALVIACFFAFETADVVCRTSWRRAALEADTEYRPKVSLHVPAYSEPPEMLIETISALEALDYEPFEIVVIDNNTTDEALWRPVEEYCAGRERVRFVHVAPWPGFKSGALNLALEQYTSPDAEVIGVIDADYLVQPDYLRATVGYFAEPRVGFVQTPQDFRDWQGNRYLTACYDASSYFFHTAMPSRNERDSIIFGGTMGLIRRQALEEMGGWDEWCITEDAEASLRMLRAGWSGVYVPQSFGYGIMPLTFAALKRQMFRWCFGGIQILRKHWRSLMPWDRDPANQLSLAQRLDYLFGGVQWFGSLITLAFTVVLLATAGLVAVGGRRAGGPMTGAAVLIPLTILWSGLFRALWALRRRCGISRLRALLAFVNWLSLSWTISLGCLRGLVRSEGVFLRTPKTGNAGRLIEALRSTRSESALALAAWGGAVLVAFRAPDPVLVGTLFAWQACVYSSSAAMAWLNTRSELSSRLQRVARAHERRQRMTAYRPHMAAGAGVLTVAMAVAGFLAFGSAEAGPHSTAVLSLPQRAAGDNGPLGNIGILSGAQPSRSKTAAKPTATTTSTRPSSPPSNTTSLPGQGVPATYGAPTASTVPGGSVTTVAIPPRATATTTPATTAPAPTPSTTAPHGASSTSVSPPTSTLRSAPTSTGRPTSPTTNPHRP